MELADCGTTDDLDELWFVLEFDVEVTTYGLKPWKLDVDGFMLVADVFVFVIIVALDMIGATLEFIPNLGVFDADAVDVEASPNSGAVSEGFNELLDV